MVFKIKRAYLECERGKFDYSLNRRQENINKKVKPFPVVQPTNQLFVSYLGIVHIKCTETRQCELVLLKCSTQYKYIAMNSTDLYGYSFI